LDEQFFKPIVFLRFQMLSNCVVNPAKFSTAPTTYHLTMLSFQTILGLHCYLETHQRQTIGLVPTMGALHQGHRSLIDRARQENDLVVVSLFINPLQFAPNEDLDRYPRQLAADTQLCQAAGVDILFTPTTQSIGALPGITQVVPPASLTDRLCGRSRPNHFTGVATIVHKLFQIVQPSRAYFGQKDAQQLAVIRQMVTDLNLPVRVVGCPIVRASNGLALSSRNQYLSAPEKSQATTLYQSLQATKQLFAQGEHRVSVLLQTANQTLQQTPEIDIEYLELVDPQTMAPLEVVESIGLLAIAARIGSTRLIDNILLSQRKPVIAIDGPAGAGKSTVTKQVAQTLGLQFLDTGAMYRAVTWLVLESQVPLDKEAEIAEIVARCQIELQGARVLVDGRDVSAEIRSLEVTSKVSAIAALGAVRTALVQQQQTIGRNGGIVAEGRDMCSYVFPEAEVKIFLTATVEERARRRLAELPEKSISLEELAASIAERDYLDSTRAIAPLKKAADAVEIVSDGMSIDRVVAAIVALYENQRTV
jgi:pantoate ligase / CMP/dCMP kinase